MGETVLHKLRVQNTYSEHYGFMPIMQQVH